MSNQYVRSARILVLADLGLLVVLLLGFAFSPSKEALTHVGPDAPAWLKGYVDVFPYALIPLFVAIAWAVHTDNLNTMRICSVFVFVLTAILTTAADTLDADTFHIYSVLTGAFFALALYGWRGMALNAVFVSLFTIGVTLLTAATTTNPVPTIVYVRVLLADPPLIALVAYLGAQIRAQMDNAILREITLRKQAEAASSFKQSLLSMAAHDLRAPLNLIANGATMLRLGLYKGGQKAREDQMEMLERIENSGKASAHQVEQLLTTSRLEADSSPAVYENVSGEVIEEIAESLRDLVEGKGLGFEVAVRLNQSVYTDLARLRIVLQNLVENAAKFTARGRVRIGCGAYLGEKCAWLLEVADTGAGISLEQRSRLFQPFEQAQADHRGMGLGLYIVRLEAEKLGGRVEVRSQIGQGTTVRLVFPSSDQAPERIDRLSDTAQTRPVDPSLYRKESFS